MFCRLCGTRIDARQPSCDRCGAPQSMVPVNAPPYGQPMQSMQPMQPMPMQQMAMPPQQQLQPLQPPYYMAAPPPPAVVMPMAVPKNPGLAAVLSFFWCGVGQIYNGQIGVGIMMMCLYFVSWMLMFVLIGFVTTPILWIYGIYDAYK